MDAATQVVNIDQRAPRAKGRKDANGTEEITKPEVVRKKLDELLRLYEKVKDAREAFNDGLKAVAEEAGYNTGAVRAHVVAIASDRYAKHQQKVQQQLELFENAGPLNS